jgi:hypothetical protein
LANNLTANCQLHNCQLPLFQNQIPALPKCFVTSFPKLRTVESHRFAQSNPFFFGQLYEIATLLRAAFMIRFGAGRTLNEQDVAGVVGAVDVRVARRAALMAMRHYIGTDAFAHALIEDKIFANKLIR